MDGVLAGEGVTTKKKAAILHPRYRRSVSKFFMERQFLVSRAGGRLGLSR